MGPLPKAEGRRVPKSCRSSLTSCRAPASALRCRITEEAESPSDLVHCRMH